MQTYFLPLLIVRHAKVFSIQVNTTKKYVQVLHCSSFTPNSTIGNDDMQNLEYCSAHRHAKIFWILNLTVPKSMQNLVALFITIDRRRCRSTAHSLSCKILNFFHAQVILLSKFIIQNRCRWHYKMYLARYYTTFANQSVTEVYLLRSMPRWTCAPSSPCPCSRCPSSP